MFSVIFPSTSSTNFDEFKQVVMCALLCLVIISLKVCTNYYQPLLYLSIKKLFMERTMPFSTMWYLFSSRDFIPLFLSPSLFTFFNCRKSFCYFAYFSVILFLQYSFLPSLFSFFMSYYIRFIICCFSYEPVFSEIFSFEITEMILLILCIAPFTFFISAYLIFGGMLSGGMLSGGMLSGGMLFGAILSSLSFNSELLSIAPFVHYDILVNLLYFEKFYLSLIQFSSSTLPSHISTSSSFVSFLILTCSSDLLHLHLISSISTSVSHPFNWIIFAWLIDIYGFKKLHSLLYIFHSFFL